MRDPGDGKRDIGARENQIRPFKLLAAKVREGGDGLERGLPIIPLTARLREPIVIGAEDWPHPDQIDFDVLRARMTDRARKVASTLFNNEFASLKGWRWGWIGSPLMTYFGIPDLVQVAVKKLKCVQAEVAEAFAEAPAAVQREASQKYASSSPYLQSTLGSSSVMGNDIVRKWFFRSSVVVQDGQRAFIYKNGKLVKFQGPGKFRKFDLFRSYTAQVVDIVRTELPVKQAMIFEHNASDSPLARSIIDALKIVRTGPDKAAIVRLDGEVYDVVKPNSIRAFWNTAKEVNVEPLTITDVQVPDQWLQAVKVIGAADIVTVAAHELAVLVVNGAPQKELNSGSYAFWTFGDAVQVVRMERHPLPLEVTGHEALTKDGQRVSLMATVSYQIDDAVKLVSNTINVANWLRGLLRAAIDHIAETRTFNQILWRREDLDSQIKKRLDAVVKTAGVSIEDICIEGFSPRSAHANGATALDEERAHASF
jgi:regulator of protease activity HflC (stomatin/prohibitin superfamily)